MEREGWMDGGMSERWREMRERGVDGWRDE